MSRRRKPGDPRIAVGYVRVSTDEQHLGPGAQREALKAWCERNGVELVAVHEDIGVSGSRPVDVRPGLIGALGAVDEHRAGVLLVARLDRLARDAMLVDQIARDLERRGARLVSERGEGTADSDPSSVFMRQVMAAAAQHERELIRARTKAALAQLKRQGRRVGQVPYGWRLAEDGVHLEVHPVERDLLEELLTRRLAGVSLRALVLWLNTSGASPRGSRWHLTTLHRILSRVCPEASDRHLRR